MNSNAKGRQKRQAKDIYIYEGFPFLLLSTFKATYTFIQSKKANFNLRQDKLFLIVAIYRKLEEFPYR
jgi:hypothetical protein